MAFLFRPITVKPIPANAEKIRQGKRQCVRWKNRQGEWTVAELTADKSKCRVRSPYWWVEYTDANGIRQREKVSKDKLAATNRMGEIVRDVERERGGLLPLAADVAVETGFFALAEEYRELKRGEGRSEKHYKQTFDQITDVAEACRWKRPQEANLAAWSRWSVAQLDAGMAPETVNHYLRSLRSFFRWLIRSRRLASDPLAGAVLLNADMDRRLKRRALSAEDFRKFINSTRASGKSLSFLDGPARAALYLTAARTGLRAGVLAQLRPEDLKLDDEIPHIPTTARQQKNKRDHLSPIGPDLLNELRVWLKTRRPTQLLWPGKWHSQNRGSTMVRKDLARAGIPIETPDGVYDFHALRGQCATDLARAGVPLVVTQQMLGHSTPTLTARYYVRVGLADLASAAAQLGRELHSEKSQDSTSSRKAGEKKRGSGK